MMALSNAEKQARFRKKLDLERRGAMVVRNYRLKLDDPAQIERVAAEVDISVRLPSGWTDEEFAKAERKLESLENRALWIAQPDELRVPVDLEAVSQGALGIDQAFDNAVNKTTELRALKRQVDALIGAQLDDVSDAGALGLEFMKLIGQRLIGREDIAQTQGNALALIALVPEHQHPDWVMEQAAVWLRWKCDDHELALLAQLLAKSVREQEEED